MVDLLMIFDKVPTFQDLDFLMESFEFETENADISGHDNLELAPKSATQGRQ